MTLEIQKLSLPAIVIQILQSIKELVWSVAARVQLVRRVAQEPLVRGSKTLQVLGYSGLRAAEPLVRGSSP